MPATSPNQIKVANLQDMRGGLNLRADPFELANDESPDLLNVDLDPRGGVEQRRGTSVFPVVIANPNLLDSNNASHEPLLGWLAPTNCTIAQSATDPLVGTKCMLMTTTVAGSIEATIGGSVAVTASQQFTAFVNVKSVSVARNAQVSINWFTAAEAYISTSTGASTVTSTGSYTTVAVSATAPPTAAKATVTVRVLAAAVGEQFRVDKNQLARGINQSLWLDPSATTMLDSEVQSLTRFETPTLSQLVATTNNGLWFSTVGLTSWTLLGGWAKSNAVQFKDKLYIVTPLASSLAWDGSTLTGLGGTFNDNLTAPTNNNMPKARFITVFQGSVWIAGTNEADGDHLNRIRFSHPNNPADFRSFDFIDVDTGLEGDVITALVPFEDRLLVFKRKSVHAISGTGPDDFQVYPISHTLGCVDQRAVVSTDYGVYFFSWPDGVFLYDGKGMEWQSERIHPIIDRGQVHAARQGLIRLGWSNRRLWVSVPWREPGTAIPTANTRVYVLDPSLSKAGSWTVYDIAVGMMSELNTTSGTLQFVGAYPGTGWLLLLEDPTVDQPYDVLPSTLRKAIKSYYRTRWVDLGQPGQKKRWKRPEFVVHSLNAQAALPVQVYRDYDSVSVAQSFSLGTTQDPSVMEWGDTWGETWNLDSQRSSRSEVIRGSALGQARAVQLQINGPDPLSFNLLTQDESRFEGALPAWATTSVDGSVALSSAKAFEGAKSLLATANFGTNQIGARPDRYLPVLPGRQVVLSIFSMAKDVPGEVRPVLLWVDAVGNIIYQDQTTAVYNNTSTWTPVSVSATAPPSAVYLLPYVTWLGALTVGQGHYLDYVELYAADSPVGLPWGVNAIAFKFIPRPVRS